MLICALALATSVFDLMVNKVPNCAEWAMMANKLVAMGEGAAIDTLQKQIKSDFDISNIRSCHLLRVLYGSRTGQPLRAPYLGGTGLPRHSMPASDWPELPMVIQCGVTFQFTEGYMLGGQAEPFSSYAKYCRENGIFRTKPFSVPSAAEAKTALADLLRSERWRAIKWTYSSPSESYSMSPGFLIDPLTAQTKY